MAGPSVAVFSGGRRVTHSAEDEATSSVSTEISSMMAPSRAEGELEGAGWGGERGWDGGDEGEEDGEGKADEEDAVEDVEEWAWREEGGAGGEGEGRKALLLITSETWRRVTTCFSEGGWASTSTLRSSTLIVGTGDEEEVVATAAALSGALEVEGLRLSLSSLRGLWRSCSSVGWGSRRSPSCWVHNSTILVGQVGLGEEPKLHE